MVSKKQTHRESGMGHGLGRGREGVGVAGGESILGVLT